MRVSGSSCVRYNLSLTYCSATIIVSKALNFEFYWRQQLQDHDKTRKFTMIQHQQTQVGFYSVAHIGVYRSQGSRGD